jgi:hypothetical protein
VCCELIKILHTAKLRLAGGVLAPNPQLGSTTTDVASTTATVLSTATGNPLIPMSNWMFTLVGEWWREVS